MGKITFLVIALSLLVVAAGIAGAHGIVTPLTSIQQLTSVSG